MRREKTSPRSEPVVLGGIPNPAPPAKPGPSAWPGGRQYQEGPRDHKVRGWGQGAAWACSAPCWLPGKTQDCAPDKFQTN